MIVNYEFKMTENRIEVKDKVKGASNLARTVWSHLQQEGWALYGIVRDYSMIVGVDESYIALHHFIKDKANPELIEADCGLTWKDIVMHEPTTRFLEQLEQMGFSFHIPMQTYVEVFAHDTLANLGLIERDYHLMSPKHKLQIWAFHKELELHIECFFDYSLPPYGVREKIEWSNLHEVAEIENDLFQLFNIDYEEDQVQVETDNDSLLGEEFEIAEAVDQDKLEETQKLIAYTMNEYDQVIIAASFGKDSMVLVQMYLRYLIQNPTSRAKLSIISSDTGIENPVLIEHVYKSIERIKSLHLDIDVQLVKPRIEDTFYSCVFGKSMQFPSPNGKWCVSRLKIDPSDRMMEAYDKKDAKSLIVLGTRLSESINRSRSVKKHFGDGFFGQHRLENFETCSPIKYWTAKDVVTYLVRNEPPWKDYSNFNLISIYGSALSNGLECPSALAMKDVNEGVSACTGGKSPRFGCSLCTLVREDHSLSNMAKDYPEVSGYVHVRKLFKATLDIRYGALTGYKRVRMLKEKEHGTYEARFESGFGDLTIDFRTLLLNIMKDHHVLISEEEVHFIYQEVRKREFREGMAITNRFKDALFSHLPVHMGYFDTTYSPIWDPFGHGVDAITPEDAQAIQRVLAKMEAGA